MGMQCRSAMLCVSLQTGRVPTTLRCARVAGQFVPDAVPSDPDFTLPEFAVGICRAALAARSQPLERKHHVDEASCAQTSTEEARQLGGAV